MPARELSLATRARLGAFVEIEEHADGAPKESAMTVKPTPARKSWILLLGASVGMVACSGPSSGENVPNQSDIDASDGGTVIEGVDAARDGMAKGEVGLSTDTG